MPSAAKLLRQRYENELQKKIEEVYREAAKDIKDKIDDFNRRHKAKEAIHRRDVKEGRWTQERFDDWMRGQVFQGEQWEAKRQQIEYTLQNANATAIKMVNQQRSNLFVYNANYQAYQLEHGVGINFGFGLYDSSTVARLIEKDPQLLPEWKINEPKDYVWNQRNVNNSIRQGVIQGERLDQIAKRLATGLSTKNMSKMLTFARTGMTEAQNAGRQARLQEAQSMGIKVHKEWLATLDERTRWQHADLDGQKQPLDKPFRIGQYEIRYPGDPQAHPSMVYNCRCTLVGDLDDYPSEYERRDNIEGKAIKNMTYREWEQAKGRTFSKSKVVKFDQVSIGAAKTVADVTALLNATGYFRSKADLTGCDLQGAKSIASAYERMFVRYPQLIGRFDAPDAQPKGMGPNTYAWCYIRRNGRVQVNPKWYGKYGDLETSYERTVISGWHPKGTTTESIIIHELGHAVDGLLAREGILGGITSSGEYRFASSSLKSTIMKRAAKIDPIIHDTFEVWGTGKDGMSFAVHDHVSEYATKDNKEWFAECFCEYLTSASPRTVATEFGKELEKLLGRLK